MRTETIVRKIYTIDELSDDAKQRAYEDSIESFEYFLHGENMASLNAFAGIFNIKIKNYSYGGNNSFIDWSFSGVDDEVVELKGFRLAKYIWNNYRRDLFKGKYFSLQSKKEFNPHYGVKYGTYKSRHSKILLDNSCVLTGFYIDDDLLKPIYDFLNKPCTHTDMEYLIQDCVNCWLSSVQSDYEDQMSIEAFYDNAQANEWEFYSDGRML